VVGATAGAAPSSGLPTGGTGGGGDASGDYSGPASNKFSYGYHPPPAGSPGPVLAPGDTPATAGDMTLQELMAWVEQNLWAKLHARIAAIDADPEFKKFLDKKGIKPGQKITNALRKEFIAQQVGAELKSRTGAEKDVTKAGDAVAAKYDAPSAEGASKATGEDAVDPTGGSLDTEASAGSSGEGAPELSVSRFEGGIRA
jgi:hypothetical protein